MCINFTFINFANCYNLKFNKYLESPLLYYYYISNSKSKIFFKIFKFHTALPVFLGNEKKAQKCYKRRPSEKKISTKLSYDEI